MYTNWMKNGEDSRRTKISRPTSEEKQRRLLYSGIELSVSSYSIDSVSPIHGLRAIEIDNRNGMNVALAVENKRFAFDVLSR